MTFHSPFGSRMHSAANTIRRIMPSIYRRICDKMRSVLNGRASHAGPGSKLPLIEATQRPACDGIQRAAEREEETNVRRWRGQ